MNLFDQINHAHMECETFLQYIWLYYKILVSFMICFPLLFLAGFITGAVQFKNPIKAGVAVVSSVF